MLTNEDKRKLQEMTLDELAQWIWVRSQADTLKDLTYYDRADVHEALGNHLARIGRLWDMADGVDSDKGSNLYTMGTANHRSMTYKCRKLAGYSYP